MYVYTLDQPDIMTKHTVQARLDSLLKASEGTRKAITELKAARSALSSSVSRSELSVLLSLIIRMSR